MTRFAPTLLVVLLLAATALAFGVTERLKLEGAPIAGPEVTRVFSPVCRCDKELASISFRLREPDRVDVAIVDEDGEVVRRLVDGERVGGARFSTSWDGRDETGRVVSEGTYRPRLRLEERRRSILLPSTIRVDTTPPRVLDAEAVSDTFSPDGDGRNDRLTIRYRFDERAHGLLFLGERRLVRTRGQRPDAKLDWYGRIDGKVLPAGEYAFSVAAEDTAGNVGEGRTVTARIRYVELARELVRAQAGLRFSVGVRSDAETVRWRFAGGTGEAEPGQLVLRAPRRPGRYTLFVEANGHGARASVLVGPRRSARAAG